LRFFYFLFFFIFFNLRNIHSENSLTLFIIKPPREISWESPRSITWTAFKSRVSSDFHSIGHTMIQLRCEKTRESSEVNEVTGMTDIDHSLDKELLFEKGIGMGVFFYDYPGTLNSEKFVWREVSQASEMHERLATLKALLNPSSCHRLAQYLSEYKKFGVYRHFGLSLSPRKKEGAGCTSFAASFFDVAGLLNSEIKKAWTLDVYVQENLIGRPLIDQFIESTQLLYGSKAKSWAKENEKSWPLLVYDTQFLYRWIKKIWEKGSKKFPQNYFIDQKNYQKWHKKIWISLRAPGTQEGWQDVYVSNGVMSLLIDGRSVATPEESIWIDKID
jgi:hypothetical protein